MKILVVEDYINVACELKKGLDDADYTMDIIHDGEEALHLLKSNHYDLITLDIELPKMDGNSILT